MEMNRNPQTCANGCGFFGSSDFHGMCSKCFREKNKKNENQTVRTTTVPAPAPAPASAPVVERPKTGLIPSTVESVSAALETSKIEEDSKAVVAESKPEEKKKNRCWTCNKKVGLTAITCRCGGVYCGLHRYSDTHGCTYDYQGAAKDKLVKDNPSIAFEKVAKL